MGVNRIQKETTYISSHVDSANCEKCGVELAVAVPEEDMFPSFRDALVLEITGGFGAFYDDASVELAAYELVFCHDCAHKVLEFANVAIDPIHECPKSE